ncbi:MAG: hypothetical protein HY899_09685 [Deltaproteobacteria bacterium]|nr:hypothetical protein [Deltaproteobacteria bacterium]
MESRSHYTPELLESLFRRRGTLLQKGIRELFRAALPSVPDDRIIAVVGAFHNSPHIASLFRGTMNAAGRVDEGSMPSYIGSERFASAVTWLKDPANAPVIAATLTGRPTSGAPAAGASPAAADPPLSADEVTSCFAALANAVLAGGRAGRDGSDELASIAAFFEVSTERMSGWYRRHVQLVLLGLGFVLAAALNVDTLRIAQVLSQDPVVRPQIVEQALKDAKEGGLSAYRITCRRNAPCARGLGPEDPRHSAHGARDLHGRAVLVRHAQSALQHPHQPQTSRRGAKGGLIAAPVRVCARDAPR